MTEETTDVVERTSIDTKIKDLVDDILVEQDPNKTRDLVDLFNWNISKKNIVRIEKLNNLYDAVTDRMIERVDKRGDQFSNSDLLDYVKTIQGAIDTNTKNLGQIQEPPMIVQQTNTQINVNVVDKFDREAKDRILAAVQATLKQAAAKPIETTAVQIDNSIIIEDKGE